jgi:membrane protease YdiL (CAAX protease family)
MVPNNIQIKTLAGVLVFVLVTEVLAIIGADRMPLPGLALLGIVRIVQIIGILGMVLCWEKGLAAIGWAPGTWGRGLIRGAVWSLGFAVAAAIGMVVIYLSGKNPLTFVRAPLPKPGVELILFFLVGGLIGPLAEEICFRGILYTYFRRWGVLFAIIASTAVFVGLHAVHGLPLTQIVGGIVFAVAYETSRNLMVPITIHVLGNLALFSLSLV